MSEPRFGVVRCPGCHGALCDLEGVTRNAIMELARSANIPVEEGALTRHDIYTADECFLTGTAAEVIAVTKCDGRVIGTGKPGAITKQLRERFMQLARQ